MKRGLRVAAVVLLFGAFCAAGLAVFGAWRFTAPGPLAADTTIILPRGSGTSQIAARLVQAGVLADRWTFLIGVRLLDEAGALRAGEYAIPARISPRDMVTMLAEGRTVVRRLTIPEGWTVAEVLAHLRTVDGLEGEIAETPAEGSLLPETYHFSYGDRRPDIVARMKRSMDDALAKAWAERDPAVPLKTPQEALTLASIIEKETGVAAERPRVGGVFANRLRRGMKLQSDPTVTYGITLGRALLGRQLLRRDLTHESAYNTYVIDALPPGPIANPGLESLRAATKPMATDDLYFVASGDGGHAFAKTLDEHLRNVARWRQINRDQD
jgi:UPF0755 protein